MATRDLDNMGTLFSIHPTVWHQAIREKSNIGLHTVLQWAKHDQILNINCAHNLWFRSQSEQFPLLEVLTAESRVQSRVKRWIVCTCGLQMGLGLGLFPQDGHGPLHMIVLPYCCSAVCFGVHWISRSFSGWLHSSVLPQQGCRHCSAEWSPLRS